MVIEEAGPRRAGPGKWTEMVVSASANSSMNFNATMRDVTE
ncbi:hypothetical protein J2R96_005037 [Bradyrhizobium elkanii]|nr:hypothetical protein [Bradyrhizobium elkanii]